jgi:hypothetical protein
MYVRDALCVFMMRIIVVRVAERGLGKRKHEARDHAKIKRSAHVFIF